MTLDDDLAERVRELAHRTRRPFKVVLNQALRTGIGVEEKGGLDQQPYVSPVFDVGLRAEFEERNLNQVAAELEDEAALAAMALFERGQRDPS